MTGRYVRLAFAAVPMVLLLASQGHAQAPAWGFQLEWEYTGPANTEFQLCTDGTCAPLGAQLRGGTTWRAPLPLLPQGEHHLVVQACVLSDCKPGTPDLFVRVLPPPFSPRRPPIDVIDGPRVPAGRH
jgi:hypothetical protein